VGGYTAVKQSAHVDETAAAAAAGSLGALQRSLQAHPSILRPKPLTLDPKL